MKGGYWGQWSEKLYNKRKVRSSPSSPLEKVSTSELIDENEEETWLDQIEIACQIAGREQDIKMVALGKSKSAALDALRSLDNAAPWGIVKDELRRCFSEDKTRVHSATLLNEISKHGRVLEYIFMSSQKTLSSSKKISFQGL